MPTNGRESSPAIKLANINLEFSQSSGKSTECVNGDTDKENHPCSQTWDLVEPEFHTA